MMLRASQPVWFHVLRVSGPMNISIGVNLLSVQIDVPIVWADGIYSGLRSEKDKLCALVIIGVNERGQKRFLAIEDGVRESTS